MQYNIWKKNIWKHCQVFLKDDNWKSQLYLHIYKFIKLGQNQLVIQVILMIVVLISDTTNGRSYIQLCDFKNKIYHLSYHNIHVYSIKNKLKTFSKYSFLLYNNAMYMYYICAYPDHKLPVTWFNCCVFRVDVATVYPYCSLQISRLEINKLLGIQNCI